MREDIEQALLKFENKHYLAVQCDTELSFCDNDSKYMSLERKAKKFWDDYKAARAELVVLLDKIK